MYDCDHGRTAIFCPRQVCHFRRSRIDHERCTATLVGPSMLLSVYMAHSGHDEEDYIETLEAVRRIMNECKTHWVDFHIGCDVNIELTGSTVSTGMACVDQNAEAVARMLSLTRKLRGLQQLKDFNCAVTRTGVHADDRGECHTWRAWESRFRKKQIDKMTKPRDIQSSAGQSDTSQSLTPPNASGYRFGNNTNRHKFTSHWILLLEVPEFTKKNKKHNRAVVLGELSPQQSVPTTHRQTDSHKRPRG